MLQVEQWQDRGLFGSCRVIFPEDAIFHGTVLRRLLLYTLENHDEVFSNGENRFSIAR